MNIHIDTVETGSPGLKDPAPEDSGLQERGETSLHRRIQVYIHIDTVETGSRGLKYPVPEDSGLHI